MKDIKNRRNETCDLDDIRAYMKMPASDKLNWLQETVAFLQKITPAESKIIWEKLKTKGF